MGNRLDRAKQAQMTFLFAALIIAYNIITAWWHSVLIKQGRRIYHGWWATAYLLLIGILCVVSGSGWLAIFSLLIRKPVFDVALNLFRDLPMFYVSSDPDSLIDDIHYSLFEKRSEIYLLIYLFTALITLILL